MHFDIHGIGVSIQSVYQKVIDDCIHDFGYFVSSMKMDAPFQVQILPQEERPSGWRPLLRTKNSTLFWGRRDEQRVSFFGRAFVQYRWLEKKCLIFCNDSTVAYEVCYLVLLSFIGESLDRRRWHRIHAFGFTYQDRGILLLAPSGGGKSTLALEMLKGPSGQLISDDTPLIDSSLSAHPFPLRIALKERPPVADRFLRKFSRVHYGEKYVLGSDFFKSRVSNPVPVRLLVLIQKGAHSAQMGPIARWRLIFPLMKWLILGYETPQIWQLFLRPSLSDVLSKASILLSRLSLALKIMLQCRGARLMLSCDSRENWETLESFLTSHVKDQWGLRWATS